MSTTTQKIGKESELEILKNYGFTKKLESWGNVNDCPVFEKNYTSISFNDYSEKFLILINYLDDVYDYQFTSINEVINFLTKREKLIDVRLRLNSMYLSYNPNDFSSPEYEIDEHLAKYLLTHSDVKVNPSKLHTIVRYYLDDSIENLYLNGVSDGIVEGITQSDLEEVFQTIINNQNK